MRILNLRFKRDNSKNYRKYSVLLLLLLCLPMINAVNLDIDANVSVDQTAYFTLENTDTSTDILCYAYINNADGDTIYRIKDTTSQCVTVLCNEPEIVTTELDVDANVVRSYEFTPKIPPFAVGSTYSLNVACDNADSNSASFTIDTGQGINDSLMAGFKWSTQEDNTAPLLYLGVMWGLPIFCIGGIAYALWRVLLFRK